MAENRGKALPKFGEWDVSNPASAEGFTVIFSKASDEKKTKKTGPNSLVSPQRTDQNNQQDSQNPKANKRSSGKDPRIREMKKLPERFQAKCNKRLRVKTIS